MRSPSSIVTDTPSGTSHGFGRLSALAELGTANYPPAVSRRLQVVNVTAYTSAAVAIAFSTIYALVDPLTMYPVIATNLTNSVIWIALPFFHRFGPLVGGLIFALTAIVGLSYLGILIGAASGTHIYLVLTPAITLLFFGTERLWPVILITVAAAFAHLLVHFISVTSEPVIAMDQTMLLGTYASAFVMTCLILLVIVYFAFRQVSRAEAAAEGERQRSDDLLRNILPGSVADRLKTDPGTIVADSHDDVTVLFADLAGFTARAAELKPDDLVTLLNRLFTAFDSLAERYGLEKIKTIGDAYMAVGGAPTPRADHAEAVADMALDMQRAMQTEIGEGFQLRIGVHSGPVVAGVIGTAKFSYDIWGATVNLAERLQTDAAPGDILVSATTRDLLPDRFTLEDHGKVDLKGIGQVPCHVLTGRKDH